ncbi:MAG TPA: hypothetical protein VMK13_15155 [Streptosporangiaceae bacterium]|nr:hypothetical protein [Streptosporangiaceae bacterium]
MAFTRQRGVAFRSQWVPHDLSGIDPPARPELERLAAATSGGSSPQRRTGVLPGTRRLLAFLETKTVRHPVGI